jgi:hypothetical protein
MFNMLTSRFERIYIVVDALDECGRETGQKLLEDLGQWFESGKVCLLVTSRHLPFGLPKYIDCVRTVQIEADRRDLAKYIEANIEHNPNTADFKAEIISELVAGSNGM